MQPRAHDFPHHRSVRHFSLAALAVVIFSNWALPQNQPAPASSSPVVSTKQPAKERDNRGPGF